MTTRVEFEAKLRAHDWYYEYSDDHNTWRAGQKERDALQEMHASLECPFSLSELRSWISELHPDRFEFVPDHKNGPGYYDPKLAMYNMAPLHVSKILTRERYLEISDYFKRFSG